MAERITGEIGGAVDASPSSEGAVTLEGDTITVTAPTTGTPGTAISKSLGNLTPILVVIALVAVIWWFLKQQGKKSIPAASG